MAAPSDRPYARLTPTASGLGSYSSLWLGNDHLLLVVSTGYTDTYSRVQLRDIKGFFITGGARRILCGLPWAVVSFVAAWPFSFALAFGQTPVVSPIFLSVGLVGLVWNHLLGPGCHVYVVTGVQTARLPALVRRRKAMKVLARLEPLINAAQADVIGAPGSGASAPGVAPPVAPPATPSQQTGDAERTAAAVHAAPSPPAAPPPFPPGSPPV